MTIGPGSLEGRKRRHSDVCLTEDVEHGALTTWLERYRPPYNVLTQTNLGEIDLGVAFQRDGITAPAGCWPRSQ